MTKILLGIACSLLFMAFISIRAMVSFFGTEEKVNLQTALTSNSKETESFKYALKKVVQNDAKTLPNGQPATIDPTVQNYLGQLQTTSIAAVAAIKKGLEGFRAPEELRERTELLKGALTVVGQKTELAKIAADELIHPTFVTRPSEEPSSVEMRYLKTAEDLYLSQSQNPEEARQVITQAIESQQNPAMKSRMAKIFVSKFPSQAKTLERDFSQRGIDLDIGERAPAGE